MNYSFPFLANQIPGFYYNNGLKYKFALGYITNYPHTLHMYDLLWSLHSLKSEGNKLRKAV